MYEKNDGNAHGGESHRGGTLLLRTEDGKGDTGGSGDFQGDTEGGREEGRTGGDPESLRFHGLWCRSV